jgi:hypothetical protein
MDTSFWNLNILMDDCAMQTTPTTVTTRSFAKKVGVTFYPVGLHPLFDNGLTPELFNSVDRSFGCERAKAHC